MDLGESIGCRELRRLEGGENKVGMRRKIVFSIKKIKCDRINEFKQLLIVGE